jgi:Vacuolar protein sorting-associated protein 62
MDDRRTALSDVLQAIGLLVALVAYVYAIGWLVTWVHLAAARLPVAASLPAIDDKVIFATGVSAVLVMAIALAAMCAVAYAVHAGRWERHADVWSDILETSRSSARERFLQGKSPRPAPALHQRTAQEGLVRVIAGFNVGVLSVAIGLVGARFVKPLVDQWQPGHWWALLVPWALFSIISAVVLGHVNPLRGGRVVHTILWLLTAVVAMLCSAPLGLLLLTWMGIATFGRWYGKRPLPSSTFEFLRSPLPWLLLTVYALVGLAYSAMPPVSFSRTTVRTTSGTRQGGYLARNGSGVYLVSCTPLANATSIDNRVEFVAADAVKSVSTVSAQFTLDSGYRPSLPTLALHAFGVDSSTPTWIRPELRERHAPCAGQPPPRPSIGYEASQLGSNVFAGSAPPGGRARDGEAPIEQTSPEIAALAKRFQPTVLVSDTDPFWPVSVGALLEDIGSKGQPTCLHRRGVNGCAVTRPTLSDLHLQGSSSSEYLEYPATPALSRGPEAQLQAFLRGQLGRNTPIPTLKERLADPGKLDPWATAQLYFFYAGKANPASWPARNRTIGTGLVGLQYWFFYPYNYYPTFATPQLMNQAPIAGDVANTDLHQGDWEHVTVLIDPKTGQPKWLYMAHHSNEGEYLPWDSPLLSFDEGHPVVQAAYGGHPTYPAYCGARPRYANGIDGLLSDWLVCGAGRFAFRASTTPLVDIAKTPWACWRGHFGVATPSEVQGSSHNEDSVQRAIDDYYEVAGPPSPLWQAENGRLSAVGESQAESGFCVGKGGPLAPEREAIGAGVGRLKLQAESASTLPKAR